MEFKSKIFAGCAVLLLPFATQAVPITYDFQGTIGGLGSSTGKTLVLPPEVGGGVALFGQTTSGSITVDSNGAPDSNPDPLLGRYDGFGVVSAFSVTFGGHVFTLDPSQPGTSAFGAVNNNDTPPGPGSGGVNIVSFRAELGTGFFPGTPASTYQFSLGLLYSAADLSIINSDTIPGDLTALPFVVNNSFPRNELDAFFSILDPISGGFLGYTTRVSSITKRISVPESETTSLFLIGVLTLVVTRVRRNAALAAR